MAVLMKTRRVLISRLLLFVLISGTPLAVHAACYFPSGDLAANDLPCQDDTDHSVCCGPGYACLTNGICQATGKELQKPGASEFVRGSCTDKKWRSSDCPLFCMDPAIDNVGGGEGIAKCENTDEDLYWCIDGEHDESTCDTKDGVLFFPGTPSAITTIGVAPSTSASSSLVTSKPETTASHTSTSDPTSATSTSHTETTPADNDDPSPGSSSNKGAIIGGAVGGTLGGLAVGALVVWLYFRQRRKKEANTAPDANASAYYPPDANTSAYYPPGAEPYGSPWPKNPDTGIAYGTQPAWAAPQEEVRYEASAEVPPQELPTGQPHQQYTQRTTS